MVIRYLEAEEDLHAGHGHEGHGHGEEKGDDMIAIKAVIMAIVLLAGCFVFFPYLP